MPTSRSHNQNRGTQTNIVVLVTTSQPNMAPQDANGGPPAASTGQAQGSGVVVEEWNIGSSEKKIQAQQQQPVADNSTAPAVQRCSDSCMSKGVLDKIASSLECPICTNYFISPVVVQPCGHSFCHWCVTRSIQDISATCPNCRSPIKCLARNIGLIHAIDHILETLSIEQKRERERCIRSRSSPADPEGQVPRDIPALFQVVDEDSSNEDDEEFSDSSSYFEDNRHLESDDLRSIGEMEENLSDISGARYASPTIISQIEGEVNRSYGWGGEEYPSVVGIGWTTANFNHPASPPPPPPRQAAYGQRTRWNPSVPRRNTRLPRQQLPHRYGPPPRFFRGNCYNCGEYGHRIAHCPEMRNS
ncbi:hypothetical protein ACOME3_002624 [Neoechinorhynchus agilis]